MRINSTNAEQKKEPRPKNACHKSLETHKHQQKDFSMQFRVFCTLPTYTDCHMVLDLDTLQNEMQFADSLFEKQFCTAGEILGAIWYIYEKP